MLASVGVYVKSVCSFGGVILIARPQFIFGGLPVNAPSEVDMSGKRMVSVMSGGCAVRLDVVLIGFIEQGWLASWERLVAVSSLYALCDSLGTQLIPHRVRVPNRHNSPCSRKASARTPRSLDLLFAMHIGFHNRVRFAP